MSPKGRILSLVGKGRERASRCPTLLHFKELLKSFLSSNMGTLTVYARDIFVLNATNVSYHILRPHTFQLQDLEVSGGQQSLLRAQR